MSWVKFNPLRGQHEVNMAIVLMTPEFKNLPQIKLANDLMSSDKCIHISLEPKFSINRLLIKLDFYKAVWISSNDEIYFCPVNHDNFLYIVNNIGELSLVDLVHGPIVLARLEIAVQDLVLVEPFCLQDLVMCHLVRVIV